LSHARYEAVKVNKILFICIAEDKATGDRGT